VAFTDPSGGAADAFTLAIAHEERRNGATIGVLDYLAERRPPFSPESVVAEYAAVLKSYRVTTVEADKYAGAWVVEAFERHHITCKQSADPKSVLYANLLPALNSGRIELLDHARLATQLCALERRTARGGRDTIDHPPGGHDDLANCVAGVVAVVSSVGDGYYRWLEREAQRRAAKVKAPVLGIRETTTPELTAEQREQRLQALERAERSMRPRVPRAWLAGN
jgi:hypothetical protein